MLVGTALNTTGPGSYSTATPVALPPSTWPSYHRTVGGITDGTSNTIMLGSKALATQVYNQRGCGPIGTDNGQFTLSNGALRSCNDTPITRGGPDRDGTLRAHGPDDLWYRSGVNNTPFNPNDPYANDIPGHRFRLPVGNSWFQFTYQVVQDAVDLDSFNRWGSPYAGGAPLAMCDGSVRNVSYGTSYGVVLNLNTPVGGEVISNLQ
jgi:hypothetical protein